MITASALSLSRAEFALLRSGAQPPPLLRADLIDLGQEGWSAVVDALRLRGILVPDDESIGIAASLRPLLGTVFGATRVVTLTTATAGVGAEQVSFLRAGRIGARVETTRTGHELAARDPADFADDLLALIALPDGLPGIPTMPSVSAAEYEAAVAVDDVAARRAALPPDAGDFATALSKDCMLRFIEIVDRVGDDGREWKSVDILEGDLGVWIREPGSDRYEPYSSPAAREWVRRVLA
jgi:hypothetical protein